MRFAPGCRARRRRSQKALLARRRPRISNSVSRRISNRRRGSVASLRVGEAHQMNVLMKAEVAKLGAAGTQRVDAVVRWMTGTMGTAAADMARVLQAVPMASTIVAFENLIQRLTNQDSVAYSPTGRRVEGGDGRISGYDNMTFAQKRAAQDDQRRQR
jgi:hypothetical protein